MKPIEEIPFIAFGNGELDGNDEIGEFETCPNCGELHKVGYGDKVLKDGTKVPTKMLAFVDCPENGNSYLVGIDGKRI